MKEVSDDAKWLRVLQDSFRFTVTGIRPLALYAAFSLFLWLAYWFSIFEVFNIPIDQTSSPDYHPLISFLIILIGMLLAFIVQCGFLFFIDALSHNNLCQPWDAMGRIMPRLIHYISVQILAGFLILLGLIAFIIPGLYIYARLMLSDYLVVLSEKKGLGQAISTSWRATQGITAQVIILMLMGAVFAFLLIFSLGLLTEVYQTPEPSFLQTLPSEISSWILMFFWAIIRYRFYLLLRQQA